jgi:hypothetical protein
MWEFRPYPPGSSSGLDEELYRKLRKHMKTVYAGQESEKKFMQRLRETLESIFAPTEKEKVLLVRNEWSSLRAAESAVHLLFEFCVAVREVYADESVQYTVCEDMMKQVKHGAMARSGSVSAHKALVLPCTAVRFLNCCMLASYMYRLQQSMRIFSSTEKGVAEWLDSEESVRILRNKADALYRGLDIESDDEE